MVAKKTPRHKLYKQAKGLAKRLKMDVTPYKYHYANSTPEYWRLERDRLTKIYVGYLRRKHRMKKYHPHQKCHSRSPPLNAH